MNEAVSSENLKTYNVLWTHGMYGNTHTVEAHSEEEAFDIMRHWLYHFGGVDLNKGDPPLILVFGEHQEGDHYLGLAFTPLPYLKNKPQLGESVGMRVG